MQKQETKKKRQVIDDREEKKFHVACRMSHVASSGFSLIELLVVIGLVAVIGVVTFSSLLGRKNTNDLSNTTAQIVALLRQAQTDSVAQSGGASWGVYFQNATATPPFYALFSSTSSVYSASGTAGYYRLPNTVGYLASTLSPGSSLAITFSQILGTASASTSVCLYLVSQPSQQSIISIASTGEISNGSSCVAGSSTLATINVVPTSLALTVGSTSPLTASPLDQYGSPFPTTVTWASNNPSVATVDTSGNVTAVAPGTAFVTAASSSITSNIAIVTVSNGVTGYAWNDSVGWINFGYAAGNVGIGTTQLTGYAYNSNILTIALDCATSPTGNICGSSNFKVSYNPSTGNLSGWAWNDDIGWISFNCADPGVCGSSNYNVHK